jgi:hypothetical protein
MSDQVSASPPLVKAPLAVPEIGVEFDVPL